MFDPSNAPIELAMTHRADGTACLRPDPVRAMVPRLYAWRSAPETCQVCLSHTAISVRSAVPMCLRCRDERTASHDAVVALRGRHIGELRADAEQDDARWLSGYSIVFGATSLDLGGFREIILPEAVSRTVMGGTNLVALWNHNSDIPLGRISAGTLTVRADRTGLFARILPPESASDKVESVQRRDVTGQSFAFRAIEDDWQMENNTPIRYVMDMHVSEISVVTFPAYPATTARVGTGKSARSIDWLEKVHRAKTA
jgi:uncharacterized protein